MIGYLGCTEAVLGGHILRKLTPNSESRLKYYMAVLMGGGFR